MTTETILESTLGSSSRLMKQRTDALFRSCLVSSCIMNVIRYHPSNEIDTAFTVLCFVMLRCALFSRFAHTAQHPHTPSHLVPWPAAQLHWPVAPPCACTTMLYSSARIHPFIRHTFMTHMFIIYAYIVSHAKALLCSCMHSDMCTYTHTM